MGDNEFMFTLQNGDYKYIFEYETDEELENHLNIINKTCIQPNNKNRILSEIKLLSRGYYY